MMGKLYLVLLKLGFKSEASDVAALSGIPLYHGTDETFSLGRWKISKSGALGAGIYLTPNKERAKNYGKNVITAYASLERPIIVDIGTAEGVDRDPCIAALKALGVSEKTAISRVEKAYDERGYVSTGIKSVGEKLGYDGIMLYDNDELREVVVWNQGRIYNAELG
jgi:hypothetical protein